ncbi:acid protease [Macrolepiota fuliginosa MF-IS2]|uniref:Acid protease n=1 Tax=Macrolepiota fuliginosa MF-IS2 TaxID=1400762 RepID=A0A9P5X6X8_9AGAR|nr:acid protease [Macrolepiota fuliginosa MF-IS2]
MGNFQKTSFTLVTLVVLEAATSIYAFPKPRVNHAWTRGCPAGLEPSSMSLLRRSPSSRTEKEWGEWAYKHRHGLAHKYGVANYIDRLTNQNGDTSYFGSLAVGTPGTSFNVILDTGSSDFWLADSQCTSGCAGVQTFQASNSSTFQNLTTPFEITYGSGQAQGTLAQDVVQMAGFSVPNQIFATADTVSSGLLQNPVSGLLGLGFATIASSRAMPFWETLANGSAWNESLMAFHLTRFNNVTSALQLEPGGSFDMGFTNTSLYTGDIDYVSLPSEGTYWLLPLQTLNVNGQSVSLPLVGQSYAAIDTGTTLVGGPQGVIQDLYSQVPNSEAGSGSLEGYYKYPCTTNVTVQLGFGNSTRTWPISPDDFKATELDHGQCLGAFFELPSSFGSQAPSWIVGDTFLKNVYSVFRYQPPSVGFANLSSTAIENNGVNGPAPSPTTASAVVTVSATVTSVIDPAQPLSTETTILTTTTMAVSY